MGEASAVQRGEQRLTAALSPSSPRPNAAACRTTLRIAEQRLECRPSRRVADTADAERGAPPQVRVGPLGDRGQVARRIRRVAEDAQVFEADDGAAVFGVAGLGRQSTGGAVSLQAVWPSATMAASASAAAGCRPSRTPRPCRRCISAILRRRARSGPQEGQPQQAKIEAIDAHGPGGSYQIYFAALTHRHIAIEGPAGVGKTALAERLATRLDAALVVDESANPFDGDAQGGRLGAAFQAQLFRLLTRHRQQSTLKQADLFAQATVSDYLFDKDKIYAYQTLDDNELFIYQRLFELLSARHRPTRSRHLPAGADRRAPAPHQGPPDVRPRAASLDRLAELNEAFNHFFFHHTATPLLVVETSQLDLTWPTPPWTT